MQIKLAKRWKNHPPGTVLSNVSEGVLADLKAIGVLEETPSPRAKSLKRPASNKMLPGPQKEK